VLGAAPPDVLPPTGPVPVVPDAVPDAPPVVPAPPPVVLCDSTLVWAVPVAPRMPFSRSESETRRPQELTRRARPPTSAVLARPVRIWAEREGNTSRP
jgi:hypothetical protein